MTTGAYPSRRYNRVWLTQRLLNRAPEWTRARTSPVSIAQQIQNIFATEIQETEHALAHEANNAHLASCDLTLPYEVWKAPLPPRFEFSSIENMDRTTQYTPPSVTGEINGVMTSLTLAESNNLQTLFYEALPTRIEYGGVQKLWDHVIPETAVSALGSIAPLELPIEGPLYITLADNTIWEEEFKGVLYRSKIFLKGTGLLREPLEEVIPLRSNGTYKTRNSWRTLDEVYVAHLSDTATISIASFPFDEEEILDQRSVAIDSNGIEQYQFFTLADKGWGSTLVGKRYLAPDMDMVRLGLDEKTINLEIELLDQDGNNVSANAIAFWPWTNYIYVVDNDTLYVYDYSVPYPDIENMKNDVGDSRMSLLFLDGKWIYARGDTVEIHSRILDLSSPPVSNRWAITFPDGTKYRLGLDGSLWPSTVDGWIQNQNYDEEKWIEQKILFTQTTLTGSYTLEFEGKYVQEDGTVEYRITKELFLIPAIEPEAQLALPVELMSPWNIGLDEEGCLWFYNGTSLLSSKLYYDYFLVDYDKKTIWLREQYPSIKVAP